MLEDGAMIFWKVGIDDAYFMSISWLIQNLRHYVMKDVAVEFV